MSGVKGRSGRPRLPTAIKLLRGTLKPSRVNHDEPTQPLVARPPVPPGLDDDERRYYDQWVDVLLSIFVLSVQDGAAVRDLACADVRVVRARAAAKSNGMVHVDPNTGKSSVSGWARELNDARADFHRLCAAFGVTPADRTRVRAEKPDTSDAPLTDRERAKRRFFGT